MATKQDIEGYHRGATWRIDFALKKPRVRDENGILLPAEPLPIEPADKIEVRFALNGAVILTVDRTEGVVVTDEAEGLCHALVDDAAQDAANIPNAKATIFYECYYESATLGRSVQAEGKLKMKPSLKELAPPP